MDKKTISCPKNPGNLYFRETCLEIFRKESMRNWCKECEQFKNTEDVKLNAA